MTKHDHTFRGTRYIGRYSYGLGDMSYGWISGQSCSVFCVSRTPFCYPTHRGLRFESLTIIAYTRKQCEEYLAEHASTPIDEGLKTYSIASRYVDSVSAVDAIINLCKPPTKRVRKITCPTL